MWFVNILLKGEADDERVNLKKVDCKMLDLQWSEWHHSLLEQKLVFAENLKKNLKGDFFLTKG